MKRGAARLAVSVHVVSAEGRALVAAKRVGFEPGPAVTDGARAATGYIRESHKLGHNGVLVDERTLRPFKFCALKLTGTP